MGTGPVLYEPGLVRAREARARRPKDTRKHKKTPEIYSPPAPACTYTAQPSPAETKVDPDTPGVAPLVNRRPVPARAVFEEI